MSAPSFSVVITAHNERRGIGPCLLSLSRQSGVAEGDLEVIFVDDRSSDGTSGAVAALALPFVRAFRTNEAPPPGMTSRQRALDLAFKAARGSIVLTLDADSLAPPDWLRGMTAKIENGSVDAVAGLVAFRSESGWIADCQSADAAFYLAVCRLMSCLGIDGGAFFGNFAFRRELYRAVGGFERIGFALTEDLAFVRALRGGHARIAYQFAPAATVRACEGWRALLERAKRVGAGPASPLLAGLAVWMGALVALAALALIFPSPIWTALAVLRYATGAGFAAGAIAAAGRRRLLPLALAYEPLAILLGVAVALGMARDAKVAWGGVEYERR